MKKNIILALLLFFISYDALAYVCRTIKDQKEFKKTGPVEYTLSVPLDRKITPGTMVFFDLSNYFECMNEESFFYDDYMELGSKGITTMLPDDFATGAVINGITRTLPVSAGISVFKLTDGNWHNVGIQVYYKLKKYPGKLVKIGAGETIATVYLHKYSIPAQGISDFIWRLKADNDSIYTAGTCEINHGNDIHVDFGSVPNWQLSSSSESSLLRRRVEVPYNCENPITMPVSITLSAPAPGFSSDMIKLSDPQLGVQMFYKGQAIKPGDSIRTSLAQGVGSDIFEFVLVKKEDAKIKPGPFTGSAVLVMSVV